MSENDFPHRSTSRESSIITTAEDPAPETFGSDTVTQTDDSKMGPTAHELSEDPSRCISALKSAKPTSQYMITSRYSDPDGRPLVITGITIMYRGAVVPLREPMTGLYANTYQLQGHFDGVKELAKTVNTKLNRSVYWLAHRKKEGETWEDYYHAWMDEQLLKFKKGKGKKSVEFDNIRVCQVHTTESIVRPLHSSHPTPSNDPSAATLGAVTASPYQEALIHPSVS